MKLSTAIVVGYLVKRRYLVCRKPGGCKDCDTKSMGVSGKTTVRTGMFSSAPWKLPATEKRQSNHLVYCRLFHRPWILSKFYPFYLSFFLSFFLSFSISFFSPAITLRISTQKFRVVSFTDAHKHTQRQ